MDRLAKAAAAQQRADFLAEFPFAAGGAFADGARNFQSWPFRPSRRWRVVAGALKQVGTVKASGFDFDDHGSRSADGVRYVAPDEFPIGAKQHCFHFCRFPCFGSSEN